MVWLQLCERPSNHLMDKVSNTNILRLHLFLAMCGLELFSFHTIIIQRTKVIQRITANLFILGDNILS